MYRNGIGPLGRSLRTRVQCVRRTTTAVHWNARDSRCDKEGGPPSDVRGTGCVYEANGE